MCSQTSGADIGQALIECNIVQRNEYNSKKLNMNCLNDSSGGCVLEVRVGAWSSDFGCLTEPGV